MSYFRNTLIVFALAAAALGSSAQSPATPAPASGLATSMAAMDNQMKAMRTMHEKMASAKTQDERNALMAEHMKTMQDGMAMMGGMGPGGMGGMMGMGRMQGGARPPGDLAARQQMMEKHMEMMQSMMQMMMDRLPPTPAK